MRRGQGSLEYLLILAAILAIAVVIVLIANMLLGTPKEANLINQDKYNFATNGWEIRGYDKPITPSDPCASGRMTFVKGGKVYSCNPAAPAAGAEPIGVITDQSGDTHTVYADNDSYYVDVGQVANCTDGVQNGDETGVDCGGSCPNNCPTPTATPTPTPTPVCGNNIVESGEQCDNGTDNGNACTASYGETCAWCSSDCQSVTTVTGPYCGDGNIDAGYEQCDDGNTNDGDCCSSSCQYEDLGTITCGTGVCENTVQKCVDGVEQTCTPKSPTENQEVTCNDGLDNDCDGYVDSADTNCQPGSCGDGVCNTATENCSNCKDCNCAANETCESGVCTSCSASASPDPLVNGGFDSDLGEWEFVGYYGSRGGPNPIAAWSSSYGGTAYVHTYGGNNQFHDDGNYFRLYQIVSEDIGSAAGADFSFRVKKTYDNYGAKVYAYIYYLGTDGTCNTKTAGGWNDALNSWATHTVDLKSGFDPPIQEVKAIGVTNNWKSWKSTWYFDNMTLTTT